VEIPIRKLSLDLSVVVQVGDVPPDSIAASSFDWWSGHVNDIFQNRYQKRDSFEMRKIDPKSRIHCTDFIQVEHGIHDLL
jgi:hypothetical protein